jgi:hypothetical protein
MQGAGTDLVTALWMLALGSYATVVSIYQLLSGKASSWDFQRPFPWQGWILRRERPWAYWPRLVLWLAVSAVFDAFAWVSFTTLQMK